MSRPRSFDWGEAARLRAEGLTYAEVAERLGVSRAAVTQAINGRKPVSKLRRPRPETRKFDWAAAARFYKMGWSYPRIAAQLGVSPSAILRATRNVRCASGPRPLGMIPRPIAERFWEKVSVGGQDECWVWTASLWPDGYGVFRRSLHKTDRAHRVAYELAVGPIPEALCVLHSCDNPPCCNPRHLSLGDRAENVRQMAERGRAHWSPGRVPAWQGRGASS